MIFGRYTESRGLYILGPGEYQVPGGSGEQAKMLSWLHLLVLVVWIYILEISRYLSRL